jgi:uncharacterized protein
MLLMNIRGLKIGKGDFMNIIDPNEIPAPVACTIDLTEGCNLACDYCFTWSKHKPKKIDKKLAKRIIDWWLPQTKPEPGSDVTLSWWGGEPLLEWELMKTLTLYAEDKAARLGKSIGFGGTTNGILYTPDKVQWTAEHKSLFLVSLDGIEPAHNLHRKNAAGQGSWKKVVKNLREGLKIVPHLKVRASFGPDTMKYFYESIQFFFEDLGLQDVAFSAVYEGDWTEEVWDTMREQFELSVKYAVKKMKEGKPCVLKHLNDEACLAFGAKNVQNPCGAGTGYMAWSVDGYGFPCHRFNKHGITTAEKALLPTIIARPVGDTFEWCNQEWRKKFWNFKNNPQDKCKECEIYGFSTCNGGCYALNFDFTGDPNIAPEVECKYNLIQHEMGKLFKELAEKENLRVQMSGWNGENMNRMDPNQASCVCYNMCYSEGTDQEIIHTDRKNDQACLCNMAQYDGPNNPPNTRIIKDVMDEKIRLKQIFGVVKQILATAGEPKSDEQKKLEQEIIDKLLQML